MKMRNAALAISWNKICLTFSILLNKKRYLLAYILVLVTILNKWTLIRGYTTSAIMNSLLTISQMQIKFKGYSSLNYSAPLTC